MFSCKPKYVSDAAQLGCICEAAVEQRWPSPTGGGCQRQWWHTFGYAPLSWAAHDRIPQVINRATILRSKQRESRLPNGPTIPLGCPCFDRVLVPLVIYPHLAKMVKHFICKYYCPWPSERPLCRRVCHTHRPTGSSCRSRPTATTTARRRSTSSHPPHLPPRRTAAVDPITGRILFQSCSLSRKSLKL